MSATFPTGIKSFSTKLAGQTVAAAHVNDLQDEVVALETQLVTGPLKPALGSAAAPTYALVGDLDTGMYSSGANALEFATNGVKALGIDSTQFIDSPTQPRASAFNSGVQSVASASFTVITFDSEDYDVGGMHSTSANTSRMTIPTGGDGLYLLTANITFAPSTTGNVRGTRFVKNGATLGVTATILPGASGSSVGTTSQLVAVMNLVAGDYVEVDVLQDTGSSMNIGNASFRYLQSQFQIVKLW